jgi:uracil-DNA glycosylase
VSWSEAWTEHLRSAGLATDTRLNDTVRPPETDFFHFRRAENVCVSVQERQLRETRVALHLFRSATAHAVRDYVGEGGSPASGFVARRLRETLKDAALADSFTRFAQLDARQQIAAVELAAAAIDRALPVPRSVDGPHCASARQVAVQCASEGRMPALVDLVTEPGWRAALEPALRSAAGLEAFLHREWAAQDEGTGPAIFPERHAVFRCLNACPLAKTRVIIVGQDPYHGPLQACGLAFSLPSGSHLAQPSSLRNILGEIQADCGLDAPRRGGDLAHWARQGVLLLNTTLTVRQGDANSHADSGWKAVTDAVLAAAAAHASASGTRLVALLWGAHARAKAPLLAGHIVFEAVHPSGLSAHRGFLGCRHFSAANAALTEQGHAPVDWRVCSTV